MKLELYSWQKECLDIWFIHGCRGILNVVTGAGKTVMALSGMERLSQTLSIPLHVKIIVPQTFLTAQWSNVMQKLAGIPRQEIGYYYGTHKDSPDRSYMIYVINSARYSLSRHILQDIRKGYAVLLIADECHHYASPENRKIFEFLPHLGSQRGNYYSLGLSATPQTAGYQQYLVPALGTEIYRYTFDDATAGKNIRSFACFNIALNFTPAENESYEDLSIRLSRITDKLMLHCPSLRKLEGMEFFHALKRLANLPQPSNTASMAQNVLTLTYQRKSLVYNAASRIHCAQQLIGDLKPDSKIIIFGERIEQADSLYYQLNMMYPGQVGRYHSKMEIASKKNTLDRYRNGEIRILITCRALDEGFDIPSANVGIVLSSSSVERQRIQRLGRILRNSEDNSIAGLYYLFIQDSAERPDYIEETSPDKAYSYMLSFDDKTGEFQHPVYEELALSILERLKRQGKTQQTLDECRRCLSHGMLRSDWLLTKSELTAKIIKTESTREQNYWICMKLLHQQSAGIDKFFEVIL